MDRTRAFELLKWPLLLILAAAGLWFFGDMLDPRRGLTGEGDASTVAPGTASSGVQDSVPELAADPGDLSAEVQADSSRVLMRGFPVGDLEVLRDREEALPMLVNVYALQGERSWDSSMLPMDGDRRVTVEGVLFQARHAFLPEVRYHVRVSSNAALLLDTTFVLSRPQGLQSEQVTGVFPSADSLPQNLLKFYIHFSGPMSRGQAYEHISIRDAAGQEVPDAFLELPQELWDPGVTRLTILFDPGRIKRGLDRHNLMGVAFEPGRRYALVVDSAMEDGSGLPMGETYRREFLVTEPDREMPDHRQWRIEPPEPGSRDPLVMRLDEPMDRALLQRLVTVYLDDGGGMGRRVNGTHIPGRVQTRDGERTWVFVPDEPWTKGNYALEINRRVEDLAGNNLISVFDVDLAEGADDPVNPARPSAQPGEGSESAGVVVKTFKIIGE